MSGIALHFYFKLVGNMRNRLAPPPLPLFFVALVFKNVILFVCNY